MTVSTSPLTPASPAPTPPRAPPDAAGASRVAKLVALLGVAALALWIGARGVEAVRARHATASAAGNAAPAAVAAGAREAARGEPRTWEPTVALEGTLAPVRETPLGFAVGGRLVRVAVEVGATVKQGAVLGVLDAAPAGAQARLAEANIKAAQAQLALADDANRRTGDLVQSGAVGQASGVQAGKQRELAAAQLEAAQAQLAAARVHLGNHSVVAPFAGSITMAPSAPGAIIAPGVPLFHLSDTSRLRLVGSVGEGDFSLVKPGLDVEVSAQGRTLRGKVTAVLSAVDPGTRRVRVEAELDNDPAAPVLAGVFARGAIRGGAPAQVLRFPVSVLRPGSQDEVLVAAADGVVARRVSFVVQGDDLLVREGVAPDEALVLAPAAGARETK